MNYFSAKYNFSYMTLVRGESLWGLGDYIRRYDM